jgi:FHA domain/von Willebrand factor type A domain
MKIRLMLRGLCGWAGAAFLIQIAMMVSGAGTPVLGQTPLETVSITPPAAPDTRLRADFYLPQADNVSSVEVRANGIILDKANAAFTPADQIQNYTCAVLLLVDKTLGNEPSTTPSRDKLLRAVRSTLGKFGVAAFGPAPETSEREQRPGGSRQIPSFFQSKRTSGPEPSACQIQLATIGDGNFAKLTRLGCERATFEQAIAGLKFDSTSPQLFFGLKQAIEYLSPVSADRKFLVVISAGTSNDTQNNDQEVIEAALKAHVHIFTIGFPGSANTTDVQRLQPLAEKTGGYSVQAGGFEQRLPAGTENDLLKRMISGGRVDVNLAGLTAPIDLGFTVQTQTNLSYKFTYKVENLAAQLASNPVPAQGVSPGPVVPPTPPAPPGPGASPTPTPAATLTPEATPTPTTASASTPPPISNPTPSPTATPVAEEIGSLIVNNPVPLIGLALVLVGGLVSLPFLLRRWRKPSTTATYEQNTVTQVPPSDLTQMASPVSDRFVYPEAFEEPEPVEQPEAEAFEPAEPFEPEAPAIAWLESLDGEQTRYPIRKTAVRIGRKPDNDIVMKNDTVSGHHAEILKRGDEFTITDLGSSNQVFVGGKPVEKSSLKNGDLIELGEVRLRFLRELDGDAR